MTDHRDSPSATDPSTGQPQTHQKGPDRELELKLKKNPQDLDTKADVGSDESMDASDPSAATQPGGNDPAPSSQFPEGK